MPSNETIEEISPHGAYTPMIGRQPSRASLPRNWPVSRASLPRNWPVSRTASKTNSVFMSYRHFLLLFYLGKIFVLLIKYIFLMLTSRILFKGCNLLIRRVRVIYSNLSTILFNAGEKYDKKINFPTVK